MNIKNFFKRLFYNSNLDFLNEKDIIWAKRYDTEDEMLKIEEGHRESPYIVIYKRGKKVYALECTSNKSIKSLQLLKLEFKRKYKYNLKKDGYIFVGKLVLLNKERFLGKVGKIDDEDLNRIYKSIYLINKRYKNKKVKYFPKVKLKFYYEVGDIILYDNKMFYINKIDDDYYYGNQVYESNKGKRTIKINDISYSMNLEGNKKISKNSKIKLLNITDKDIQENIQFFINEQKKKKLTSKKLGRGKLILLNNEYFYIYGEYQDNLLVYKIYLDRTMNEEMSKIYIKKGRYYTLFEESEISKKEDIIILREATELEMDDIKKLKKSNKRK